MQLAPYQFVCVCVCVSVSLLSSAVYQADPVREAGSGLEDRGPGAGGQNWSPVRPQEKVPEYDKTGSDAGRPAVPDDADPEAARRRLHRPQPQDAGTPCESIYLDTEIKQIR